MCVWQLSCRSATSCQWVWCLRVPSSAALRRRQVTVASWLAPVGTSAPSSATTLTPGGHGSSCPPEPRRSCPHLTAPWLVSMCWWISDRNVFVETPRFLWSLQFWGSFCRPQCPFTDVACFEKIAFLAKVLVWKFHGTGQQIICSMVTRREKLGNQMVDNKRKLFFLSWNHSNCNWAVIWSEEIVFSFKGGKNCGFWRKNSEIVEYWVWVCA